MLAPTSPSTLSVTGADRQVAELKAQLAAVQGMWFVCIVVVILMLTILQLRTVSLRRPTRGRARR